MRSPAKGRAPRLTLADLAAHQVIDCFLCQKPKTAAGAQPFRAYQVCADCAKQVKERAAADRPAA